MFPPWLTLMCLPMQQGAPALLDTYFDLNQKDANNKYRLIAQRGSLLCPCDVSNGAEGGRANNWRWQGQANPWPQYDNTDIDPPDGYGQQQVNNVVLDGSRQKTGDTIPCSYIFEFCGEPCEWASGSVPDKNEWQWIGGVPSLQSFYQMCHGLGNVVPSWYAVKKLTMDGYPGQLPPSGTRVPMVRCFWHLSPIVKDTDANVMNITGAYAVYKGYPSWYEDKFSQ
jgi:hypothetical protein